jgi:hypothetical protein
VRLPLHLVHRFEFSSEIVEVKVHELITLGFLEPKTTLWCLGDYPWESPIKLWMRAPRFM